MSDSLSGRGQNPRYFSNVRHEMAPFVPARYTHVLEVGCGEGVSAQLFPHAREIWGVEMERVAAEHARQRMKHVLVGTFKQVCEALPLGYFDLVVCHDVIEHMADPEEFLRSVQRYMTGDGHVMSSIPNMRHWEVLLMLVLGKDWRYTVDGIMDRTHLRFFTERSIRRLFEENGFVVLRHAGINGVFDRSRRLLLRVIVAVTFGCFDDIQYRQFGTLAQRK